MGFWTRAAELVRPVAIADAGAVAQPVTSRPEPAWPSLPVIQRVVTPTPPVADRAPFVASLRSHQNPSFLAPLAHLIDPDGPGGRIGGLVTPAATAQRSAEQEPGLLHHWPQRFDDGPVLRSAPGSLPEPVRASAAQVSRTSESIAQRSVADAPSSPAGPVGAPDAAPAAGALRQLTADDEPVPVQRSVLRTLPVVATAASEDVAPRPPAVATEPVTAQRDGPDAAPPDVSIARVADVAEAAPPVQRLVAVDPPSGDGTQHRAPASRSHTDPEPPVQRTVPLPSPNAPVPTPPEGLPAQPSPGAGVVEQVHAPQPAAPRQVQRTPAFAADTPALSRAAVPTANEAVASAPLFGATAQQVTAQRTTAQRTSVQRTPVPDKPVPRASAQPTAAPTTSIASAPHASAPDASAPHATAPHASPPLAGTPPTSVQRTPYDSPHGAAVPHPSPVSAPAQAPSVQRTAAAAPARLGLGAPLQRAPAPATRIETVSLQEWAAARAQPPTMQRTATASEPIGPEVGITAERRTESVAAPSIASRVAVTPPPTANPPVAQRFVDEPTQIAMPEPTGTPRVQRLVHPEAAAAASTQDAGSIAVAAGIAQRDADGSVTFDTPATQGATVQRAVEVDEMTAAGAPEPTTQPRTTAAPHAATAAAAPNIDDLARRLYDPLAARLKAELRLDRERFGLVTDLYR